ncbi:ADP,ATP carrier protein [Asimina triloba]
MSQQRRFDLCLAPMAISRIVSSWSCYHHLRKPDPDVPRPLPLKREACMFARWRGSVGICASPLAQPSTPVEDDNPSSLPQAEPPVERQQAVIAAADGASRKLVRDLSSLPTSPHSESGVPGAFSEAAALKAYPECETIPCEQFEAAFKAVELWLVDKAVLPIENSLGGSIHRNYDLLLRHRLHIVGEVQLAVNHCLLGLPGVKMEDLKRAISHPQALAQCEITLSKLGVIRESMDDTAGAAQFVAANDLRDTAAVASARAAEIYGLNILAEGIQDDPDNITRFLILAREPIIPRTNKPFKTSIVFTLEEGPGVLFKALAVFAMREINLTKIESRPQRKRPLRVVDDSNTGSAKYLPALTSMAEPRAQNALGHLQGDDFLLHCVQEFATFLRVLGCYPMDTTFCLETAAVTVIFPP